MDEYARRFTESHGIEITFTDEAAELLITEALERSLSVRELCAERFKDFHFGLKLIIQNSGVKHFAIDANAIKSPDKTLSEWVVASYRSDAPGPPAAP